MWEMNTNAILISKKNSPLKCTVSELWLFTFENFQSKRPVLCLGNLPGPLTFLSKTNGIDFSMQFYIVCFYQEFLHVYYIRINNWLDKRMKLDISRFVGFNFIGRCNSHYPNIVLLFSIFFSKLSSLSFILRCLAKCSLLCNLLRGL